jgi:hypothetical protein
MKGFGIKMVEELNGWIGDEVEEKWRIFRKISTKND